MTNFGLRNMAAVVVGKEGGGKPPLLFTLNAIPFQANSYDCAWLKFVCMVSIFCIVLPQFVIAMTIIFYSETSLKRTLSRVPRRLIVVDWAMKYLPQRYRERMSDFFGKRGRSWRVSAVITKHTEKFQVECFVHLFDKCTQNSFAVASIIEHLLNTIKKESPEIENVFLRSDNAGCYHSGSLLLSLPFISQRNGMTTLRYDFSEPQSGKDICDRKTAPMKAHIRRWVNEKHNVITAEDMKTALESHGGVKGVRAAVVQVDINKEITANKIPGISLLNNFSFEGNGIRAWRAFSVGPGRFLSYSQLEVAPQEETGLKVQKEWGPRSNNLGSVSHASSPRGEIFSCSESTCVLTFKTREEAEAYMDAGKHVRASDLDCESVYDVARK